MKRIKRAVVILTALLMLLSSSAFAWGGKTCADTYGEAEDLLQQNR